MLNNYKLKHLPQLPYHIHIRHHHLLCLPHFPPHKPWMNGGKTESENRAKRVRCCVGCCSLHPPSFALFSLLSTTGDEWETRNKNILSLVSFAFECGRKISKRSENLFCFRSSPGAFANSRRFFVAKELNYKKIWKKDKGGLFGKSSEIS